MHITAIDLVKTLHKGGYQAYFAGGSVRDMLLGNAPKDIDIVTDALPDELEKIFENTIPVGKQFGVIVVVEKGHHFEIATFRSDAGYSDGRRPDAVTFTSAKNDAKRRDFTINGMFYDPIKEKYLDYVEGRKDLQAKLIRFIGNPEQRILEDHLRLLRAVRFRNQFDFQYEPDTYDAVKKYAPLILEKVSTERIREELNKMILDETKPSMAFEDMSHLGILKLIIPELERLRGCAQPYKFHHEGDVWTHTMAALDSLPPDAPLIARWATLFHDIGKPDTFALKERIRFNSHASKGAEITRKIMKRLKFSREQIKAVEWCIEHHMMMASFLTMNDGRLMHWLHNPQMKNLMHLMYADAAGTEPGNFTLYKKIEKLYKLKTKRHPEMPKPFLNGKEIMEITGLSAGNRIGELKEKLYALQLDRKIRTKNSAERWVKKNAK